MAIEGTFILTKALFDVLLSYGKDAKHSHLQGSMYYKDLTGRMDYAGMEQTTMNSIWKHRYNRTKGTKTVEAEGQLPDAFIFSRYLPDSDSETPGGKEFRLMIKENAKKLKVELLDVAILGCYVTLDPEVIRAHTKTLEAEKAMYP